MRFPDDGLTRKVYIYAVDATDNVTPEPNLTSGWNIRWALNGGNLTTYTGNTANNKIAETNTGNVTEGVYELTVDWLGGDELDDDDDSMQMLVYITNLDGGAVIAPIVLTYEIYRIKITNGRTLDINSSGDLNGPVPSVTGAVTVSTNNDKTGYSISGTKQTLDALNDLTTAQVNTEVDNALGDYDGPTKAEMDTGFAALNDLSAAQVNAQVDAALADYDGPTKAEMDSGFAALNDFDPATDTVARVTLTDTTTTNTDMRGTDNASLAADLTDVENKIDSIIGSLVTASGEPGQGNLPESASSADKLSYIYKTLRNKKTSDGSFNRFFANDGTTVDHKASTTESAGTVTVGEMEAP